MKCHANSTALVRGSTSEVLGRPRELIFCWSLARKAIVQVW